MGSTTKRRLGPLAVVVACGIAALLVHRYWTRPPAVEFGNLRYIQLLWTAVSSRDADRLDRVEAALHRRRESEEMSDRELAHFLEVIAVAK